MMNLLEEKQRGQISNSYNESLGRTTEDRSLIATMNLLEEKQRGQIPNSHNESFGRETKRTDP